MSVEEELYLNSLGDKDILILSIWMNYSDQDPRENPHKVKTLHHWERGARHPLGGKMENSPHDNK
jgi:hypothetical protein